MDADEGDEDVGGSGLSWLNDTGNKLSELGVLIGVSGGASMRRGRGVLRE